MVALELKSRITGVIRNHAHGSAQNLMEFNLDQPGGAADRRGRNYVEPPATNRAFANRSIRF